MVSSLGYEQDLHVRTELDSHTDTCCFGSGACVISEDTSHTVEVMVFLPGMRRKQETKIGMDVVAYDEPKTFTTYILIFHQSLIIPDLKNNLLCPFQMHLNGIEVNEVPLEFRRPSQHQKNCHAIVASEELTIPLALSGGVSSFLTRKPRKEEIDDVDRCPQIEMTYHDPVYNPKIDQHESIDVSLRCDVMNDVPYARRD